MVVKLLIAVNLIFLISCGNNNEQTMNTIKLKEGTVTSVNGEDIGCANIMEDTYELSDGTKKEGLTGQLFFKSSDTNYTVGEGSEINIKEKNYRVKEVKKGAGSESGFVILLEQ